MSTQAEMEVNCCVADLKARGRATDRRPEPVAFEVLGVSLFLRAMTAAELARFWKWDKVTPAPRDIDAAMFCLSVCDSKGNLQFDLPDVPEVASTIDRRAITAVAVRAVKLNRF